MTAIPLIDLKAQHATIAGEIRVAIDRVVDSQQFILGPEVEALEKEIAAYCGVRHAVGVSSGTDALLVALMALDIGPGDEVVVPTFSFFATAGVVARLGARPVFVDIDRRTFNLDPAGLEAAISPRTRAIMPVHLFGQTADMEPIQAAAAGAGVPVVEDAAQAIGADYHGRRAGTMGLLACFSFFPTKNLGGFGDGGMVVTDDGGLADRLRRLRMHGFADQYRSSEVGGNFRLDALQAAVLRVKLRHLEEWHEGRRRNARRYRELFEEAGLGGGEGPVRTPHEAGFGRHIYHQYTLSCRSRDELRRFLTERQIGTAIYYPVPLHLQECFATLGHRRGDFPVAEAVVEECLALPIYPELGDEAARRVVATIHSFYRSREPHPQRLAARRPAD
jgi:dTDP-4-amino-4,6-dideoxygalactose transaminase